METFPRNWPFVRGIHRSPVNSPHKGQWRGALMFSLICVSINDWVNNREAGDLRRYRAHCDVNVMCIFMTTKSYHSHSRKPRSHCIVGCPGLIHSCWWNMINPGSQNFIWNFYTTCCYLETSYMRSKHSKLFYASQYLSQSLFLRAQQIHSTFQ